jgi:hypothetical protein
MVLSYALWRAVTLSRLNAQFVSTKGCFTIKNIDETIN